MSTEDGNMAKNKVESERQAIVYVAAMVPSLLWHLGWAYLRMRRRANREGRFFYRALVKKGVPREVAVELANEYSSSISLTKFIREGFGRLTS
jgi:hypothetical protein